MGAFTVGERRKSSSTTWDVATSGTISIGPRFRVDLTGELGAQDGFAFTAISAACTNRRLLSTRLFVLAILRVPLLVASLVAIAAPDSSSVLTTPGLSLCTATKCTRREPVVSTCLEVRLGT